MEFGHMVKAMDPTESSVNLVQKSRVRYIDNSEHLRTTNY